jgi:LmbE family N-acetylglucosaminyl deacetylase
LALVQSLQRVGLPIEVFNPTAKAHADEWPLLSHALAEGRLVLPQHERLREELVSLLVEVGPQGARVTDRGRVHQDHAVAVRGVVASLRAAGAGDFEVLAANVAPEPRARVLDAREFELLGRGLY